MIERTNGKNRIAGGASRLISGIVAPVLGVVRTLERWSHVAAQRKALLAMDDHLLKDIGLTRADALWEASRHFWDVPRSMHVAGDGAEPQGTDPSREVRSDGTRREDHRSLSAA